LACDLVAVAECQFAFLSLEILWGCWLPQIGTGS